MKTNLSRDLDSLVDDTKLQLYEQSYKRKLTPLQAVIIDNWNNTVKATNFLWTYPDIPQKKLNNAVSEYAKYHKDELILGLQDSSAFGSGKSGLIFTTEGIYSNRLVIKYSEIDLDLISYRFKSSSDQKLIIDENRNFPLLNIIKSDTLSMLTTFIKNAINFTPSTLPDEQWEFAKNIDDTTSKSIKKFYSKDDIKKAILSHEIKSSFYYRRYNRLSIKENSDKGVWMQIEEPLYKEFELSKEAIIKQEKTENRFAIISFLVAVGVIIVVIVLLIPEKQGPGKDLGSGEWGAIVWSTLGSITGTIIAYRINKIFGILAAIGSLLWILRLFNNM